MLLTKHNQKLELTTSDIFTNMQIAEKEANTVSDIVRGVQLHLVIDSPAV